MITEKVLKTVQENNMLSTGDKVLLGVSGGADSVCLLCVLKELFEGLDITVLHLHHGIRGAEADRDAEFVRELCKKHGAEFILVKRDIPAFAKERGLSEEEAGRIARYEEFEKAAKERGITKIAVAHNMNDAAETFIHNLCRGTGLAGLIGIAPVSGNIIRPLISVSRAEIEEYLKEKGESFVTDSTNLSGEYTRNRIRNTVIPELAGINPKAAEHIALAGANLYEIKDFMDKCVASELKRLKREKGEVLWNEEDFLACHPALKAEILLSVFKEVSGKLKDFTAEHIRAVCNLFDLQVGKNADLPYGMYAVRTYEGVRIGRKEEKGDVSFCYPVSVPSEIYVKEKDITVRFSVRDLTEGGKASVLQVKNKEIIINNGEIIKIPESGCTKWFDCDKIQDALSVRTIKEGDKIALFEGGNGKKLKDFFVDIKLEKREREGTLLLAAGSDILYVYGKRDSSKYRIDKDTKSILMVEFINGG